MRSTLLNSDVEILFTDITDTAKTEKMEARELFIKCGAKAYEMIPFEDIPSEDEMLFYEKALRLFADDTATAVKCVAEKIYQQKGKDVVLISLARGGIPAGILIKRYLEKKYKFNIPHYALTLIGTMGIDEKALESVLEKFNPSRIQFIDGWTGKGAIVRALNKALQKYEGVSGELAVLSDPANLIYLSGTKNDILIPSACLNAPLVGLMSRSIPLKDSFFGAVFFEKLLDYDKTYDFINTIESHFDYSGCSFEYKEYFGDGLSEVQKIAKDFGILDIHFIKPGMGETMRALIRKKPDVILLKKDTNKYTDFIREIALNNDICVKEYPLERYNVCSIYKDSNSDVL